MSTKEEDNSELSEENGELEIAFKLIIIGDSGVGKSCLALKAIKDFFDDYYSPTVGFEFMTYISKVEEVNVKLQIWDTCGQEAYRSLITSYYRNSSLAIIVYSIDSEESFQNIETWINDVKTQSNPDIKMVLIGNKNDLEGERKVSKEEGERFCTDHNLSLFMETSAKTGFNSKKLFDEVAKILYQEYKTVKANGNKFGSNYNSSGFQANADPVLQNDNNNEEERKKKCSC